MTRSLKGRYRFQSVLTRERRQRGGWPHKSEAAERGTGPLVSSNLKPVVCIRSVIAVVGARLTHDGGGASRVAAPPPAALCPVAREVGLTLRHFFALSIKC